MKVSRICPKSLMLMLVLEPVLESQLSENGTAWKLREPRSTKISTLPTKRDISVQAEVWFQSGAQVELATQEEEGTGGGGGE